MTATAPAAVVPPLVTRRPRLEPLRATFGGLMSGEWIKLLSQRSTYWTMGLAAGAIIAMAATAGSGGGGTAKLMTASTAGVAAAQFAVMLLGVLVVSGEFRTGQIRSTFTADPRRTRVMAAKALVVACSAFAVTVVSVEAAMVVLLVPHFTLPGLWALVSIDTVLRLVGAGLAMAFVGILSVAVAAALRRTGLAIIGVLVVLLALPGITVILPQGLFGSVSSYLPASVSSSLYAAPGGVAGGAMTSFSTAPALASWLALVLAVAYAAAFWIGAMAILRRSDV